MTTWYVHDFEGEQGPFSVSELKQLARGGGLERTSLVRRHDRDEYVPAHRLAGLWVADDSSRGRKSPERLAAERRARTTVQRAERDAVRERRTALRKAERQPGNTSALRPIWTRTVVVMVLLGLQLVVETWLTVRRMALRDLLISDGGLDSRHDALVATVDDIAWGNDLAQVVVGALFVALALWAHRAVANLDAAGLEPRLTPLTTLILFVVPLLFALVPPMLVDVARKSRALAWPGTRGGLAPVAWGFCGAWVTALALSMLVLWKGEQLDEHYDRDVLLSGLELGVMASAASVIALSLGMVFAGKVGFWQRSARTT